MVNLYNKNKAQYRFDCFVDAISFYKEKPNNTVEFCQDFPVLLIMESHGT